MWGLAGEKIEKKETTGRSRAFGRLPIIQGSEKIGMSQRVLWITVLVMMSQLFAVGGGAIQPGIAGAISLDATNSSTQIDFEKKGFLVAHLEEDDEEEDRKYRKGHRRPKNCRHKKHYKFCGSKSLRIKTIQDLKFGKVVGDSQHGGTVIIHADTGSKTVNRLFDAGGFHSRAEFEIKGKPKKHFIITLPSQIVLPTNSHLNPRVGRFTVFPSTRGTFARNGKARVFIGATLKLGPIQQGGEGSGPVAIYVDYVR